MSDVIFLYDGSNQLVTNIPLRESCVVERPPSPMDPSEEDARSLELQAQWESAARDKAWHETYGGRRKRQLPPRVNSVPTSATEDLFGRLTPNQSPLSDSRARQLCSEFQPISLVGVEKLQGVYGIYHHSSRRFYVGSSVDIRARLRNHLCCLDRGNHHSAKLQAAWNSLNENSLSLLLIEEVEDLFDLRTREQYWIDRLRAFSVGFNSKSRADGPEPSLETHIDNAIRRFWLPAYESMRPTLSIQHPTKADRGAFRSDLLRCLPKKLRQSLIAGTLTYFGVSGFGILLLPLFYYVPVIMFDWPERPQRARDRSHVKYDEEDKFARAKADTEVIQFVAGRLGVSFDDVAHVYPSVPKVMAERARLRERYRWLNSRY